MPRTVPPSRTGSDRLTCRCLMDLPQWNAAAEASAGYVAAMQKPWPGSVAIFASPQETGYQLKAIAGAPATLGVTLDDIEAGPEGRIDQRASVPRPADERNAIVRRSGRDAGRRKPRSASQRRAAIGRSFSSGPRNSSMCKRIG